MTLAQALSTYLNLNLLILIGFIGLAGFALAIRKLGFSLGARSELKMHYLALSTILSLTALHPLLPRNEIFSPPAKVWSAQSIKSFSEDTTTDNGGYLSLSTPRGISTLEADRVALVWTLLAAILFIFGGRRMHSDFRLLLKLQRDSYLVKRVGHVRISVNDSIHVPFSYWLPKRAQIVLPTSMLSRHEEYRMAIAHEIQHHRHGDTRWVYVVWALKLICVLNPAIHLWNRWLNEIQEFACDETLVDQNKVESQAYARCLVEVAKTAIDKKRMPVCATGLTFQIERKLLQRRIEKMFDTSKLRIGRSIRVSAGLFIGSLMVATAFASKNLVQDRRVSMAEAQAMALRAARNPSSFPVVVNDLVLKQLNRYVGTPEGRQFMRNALVQMENHRAMVGEHIQRYGVPAELMAVPIIESGYRNLAEGQSSPTVKSAGIWQFIRSTARAFGLRVDQVKDERLDLPLSTDAALRYLQANYLRFKDWQLSALAYNMGEDALQKGINATGSRDAWFLIRNGYEGDKDYLARLMAAILIMHNPESVQ